MIKLFVLDLDGCLTTPFHSPDWEKITKIRELNQQSREDLSIPPVTICTGRPYPYAEAVAQWLDVRYPVIFESAGMYDWRENRFRTALNDDSDEELASINKLKQWIRSKILPLYPGAIPEFSKMMDAGVVSPNKHDIAEIREEIQNHINQHYPDLEMHYTDISVNTLIRGNNKRAGLNLLQEETGITLEEMAYIGDSGGDVVALQVVGRPFAPANAKQETKAVAEVLSEESTHAVLVAYRRLIEENRNHGSR
ncbi:MAG: HAD-IIB family hydrolase [Balneolaceae bacterium]